MKTLTKDFLMDYITSHPYGRYVGYTFVDLFKLYSELEINSIADIKTAVIDFCDFLEQNQNIIVCADPDYTRRIPQKVKIVKYHFLKKFDIRDKGDQKKFAVIVETFAPNKKQTRTLDVGASEFPYSSIVMADHFDNTTSMDKRFYLSTKSLHSMNVNTIESFFKDNTDISDHDFVVGRFPCSAIESIVRVCAQNNKPYFIELCQCKLPWPKDLATGEYFGWENVLPLLDSDVKVINGYATNIDATPEQIKKVLERQNFKRIFDLRSSLYTSPNTIFIDSGRVYTGNETEDEDEPSV